VVESDRKLHSANNSLNFCLRPAEQNLTLQPLCQSNPMSWRKSSVSWHTPMKTTYTHSYAMKW
jgi:hypothetical protein